MTADSKGRKHPPRPQHLSQRLPGKPKWMRWHYWRLRAEADEASAVAVADLAASIQRLAGRVRSTHDR